MPIVSLKELKEQLPGGKRLMGIDHGMKTWGLALADPGLAVVTPFKTIRRTKFLPDVKQLAALCHEYEVGGFVIGFPLNMDGTAGPRADSVRHFADNLIKFRDVFAFDLLIAFFDERLSTQAAGDMLIEGLDMPREKRKSVIDAHAAAHILRGALDSTLT